MKRLVIPKEQLMPEIEKQMVPQLKKEMKNKGVTGFRFVDMEWTEEGIVLYYDESSRGPNKK